MIWTVIFAAVASGSYVWLRSSGLIALRQAIGLTFLLELFYLLGSYFWSWSFPTPWILLQIFVVSSLGVLIGTIYSKVWPIPEKKGFERITRTLLISIPSIGIGIGLQLLMQGNQPTQALYLIFAAAAWLGSNQMVRK